MHKVSMSHLISFSRYQTKCVFKFLLRQLMISKTLRFFFNQPQWLTVKKRREDENTKTLISQEQKELFRLNKKHF